MYLAKNCGMERCLNVSLTCMHESQTGPAKTLRMAPPTTLLLARPRVRGWDEM